MGIFSNKAEQIKHCKQQAAQAALDHVKPDMILGIGTGSTIDYFIAALADLSFPLEGVVASSVKTANALKAIGLNVVDLNYVNQLDLYIDGTDAINRHGEMVKGAGGALTREKICAVSSQQFICIADYTKQTNRLTAGCPIPVEVIPMARSYVAREILKLGGTPVYREGVTTDNGNIILDVHDLNADRPWEREDQLNLITGVIENGLFAHRRCDYAIIGQKDGSIETIS